MFNGTVKTTDVVNTYWKALIATLTLLHSERPKLHRILAVVSAIGLKTCLIIPIAMKLRYIKGTVLEKRYDVGRKRHDAGVPC